MFLGNSKLSHSRHVGEGAVFYLHHYYLSLYRLLLIEALFVSRHVDTLNICHLSWLEQLCFPILDQLTMFKTKFSLRTYVHLCSIKRNWKCLPPQVRQLTKKQFKKKTREMIFAIFHAENTYVEALTLLLKMAKIIRVD